MTKQEWEEWKKIHNVRLDEFRRRVLEEDPVALRLLRKPDLEFCKEAMEGFRLV